MNRIDFWKEQHVVAVDVELCWKCNKDNDEAYWKYKRLSGVPQQMSCVKIKNIQKTNFIITLQQ